MLTLMRRLFFVIASCVLAAPFAKASADFDPESLRGFSAGANGELVARLEGESKAYEAKARFVEFLEPGCYRLTAEVKTSGFTPHGQFAANVEAGSKSRAYQTVSSSSDWAPLVLYFECTKRGRPAFRILAPTGFSEGAGIRIRRVEIAPFVPQKGVNWLTNPDFALGQIGEMPPGWFWKFSGKSGDFALAADTSFKTGTQVLQITGSAGEAHDVCSFTLPLMKEGEVTFEVWARSDDPEMQMTLWLIGDQYQWKGRQVFPVSKEWKKYSVSASCPSHADDPSFFARVTASGAGKLYLAGTKLSWSGSPVPDPAVESVPTGRNLLRNPGFELGLNNWMFDYFAPGSYQMATAVGNSAPPEIQAGAGIENSAAMLLQSTYGALFAGCVPLKEGKRYTLSAFVKATRKDAKLKLFLLDPGWQAYTQEYQDLSTEKWTRVALSITWDKQSRQKRLYPRFDGEGVLLDNIQLEEGPLSEFEAPALDIGFLSSSPNIFGRKGEAPWMDLKITSRDPGERSLSVELTARDAWGKSVWTKTLPVEMKGRESVTPIPLFAERLGVFTIEARVRDPQGALAGTGESRYAIVDPPAFATNGLSVFGVNNEICSLPLWLIKQEMPIWRSMGADLNRFFLRNRFYSTDPPADYLTLLRAQCRAQIDAGLEDLIACFNNIPDPIRTRILDSETLDAATLTDYSTYLRRTVEPLGAEIRYWEIANEPNLWRYKDGPRKGLKTMPPAKYVQLLEASYKTIKAIDPGLKVVGICLNGNDFPYLEECMRLGAGRFMDAFSFHSYRATPDVPDVYEDLLAYRKILDRYGFHGPMLNTEQYFAANKFLLHGSDDETRRQYYVEDNKELEACGRTIRNYIYHAAAGVPYCGYSPPLTFFRYGGYDRYYLFYAYGAYNAATRFLAQAGRATPLDLGTALRGFLFAEAEGGPLITLNAVNTEFVGSMKIPGTVSAFDMMGNPIAPEGDATVIPLSDSPVYLRFPPGATVEKILETLRDAKIQGLGEPFTVALALQSRKSLALTITNRLNKRANGRVAITQPPKGWTFDKTEGEFRDLDPGQSMTVEVSGDFDIRDNATYSVPVLVTSGDNDFVKKDFTISPILADRIENIVADGDLSEWKDAHWTQLGEQNLTVAAPNAAPHSDEKDLSARAAFAWSPDSFACAIRVTDDVMDAPESPGSAWTHDSVQIYFDQLNNASEKDPFYDGDDVAYAISLASGTPSAWIEKGSEGRYIGEANAATGIDREVEVHIGRVGNETIYEIKFPRACLPLMALSPGRSIGFAILINDNDGKGRKASLTLTPKGTEPGKKPFLFRDLYLN